MNGNLISDGSKTHSWDARNQLASLSGGATASFQYDGVGRRVGKTVAGTATAFLYDGLNPVQELTGSTPKANLLTGGLDETFSRTDSAGARHLLTDALGSTLALTDANGVTQTSYSYEPYGKASASGAVNDNSLQYTGRENDNTGLNFNRGRYYNPTLQRFVSEDPIGLAGGINAYAYVLGNPVSNADPSGLDTYVASRNLSAINTSAVPFWDPFSHTFTFSTNPDGSIAATYSWGNAANLEGWNLNQPEDLSAAAQALKDGYAEKVAPSYMDQNYRKAYDQLSNPANNHTNGICQNNCKDETVKLNDAAWKLWSRH